MSNGYKKDEETGEAYDTVCHVHDGDNRHIGTGKGLDKFEALSNAVSDASGQNSSKGSFGCGESDDEAHDRALKANSSSAVSLPGTGDL